MKRILTNLFPSALREMRKIRKEDDKKIIDYEKIVLMKQQKMEKQ